MQVRMFDGRRRAGRRVRRAVPAQSSVTSGGSITLMAQKLSQGAGGGS